MMLPVRFFSSFHSRRRTRRPSPATEIMAERSGIVKTVFYEVCHKYVKLRKCITKKDGEKLSLLMRMHPEETLGCLCLGRILFFC